MVRKLTSASTLEGLKREAKRWLKALRAREPAARAPVIILHTKGCGSWTVCGSLTWRRAAQLGRAHERPCVSEIGPVSFDAMDRSKMTARVVPLEGDEAGEPRMGGTMDERAAAVAELWRLSGRPVPSHTRGTIPVAVGTLKDHVQET